MGHSSIGLVRPALRRRAAIAAFGAVLGAGLAACATDNPPPASGSSVAGSGVSIGEWKRGGYKLDWNKPDFGGPPPGAH